MRYAIDANNDVLQLRIAGEIEPQRLHSRDLSKLITAYEDTIAAVVARQHLTQKAEDVAVGLVQVEQGSVALTFDAPQRDVVYQAALTVTAAIASERWAELPLRAVKSITRLVQFLCQSGFTAHFHTVYRGKTAVAVVTKDTIIPPSATLFGQTQIVAEVKRVGGEEPLVVLQTLKGDILYCETTVEIARQLGSFLYQQVRLSGAAQWDLESLAIGEFEIAAVLPYQRVLPSKAFAAVREQLAQYFDQIEDPDEWADDARHG